MKFRQDITTTKYKKLGNKYAILFHIIIHYGESHLGTVLKDIDFVTSHANAGKYRITSTSSKNWQ